MAEQLANAEAVASMQTLEADHETLCARCAQPLTPEEIKYPVWWGDGGGWGTGGHPLCCDCEHEVYDFTCSLCGDYANKESEKSQVFAVFDGEEAEVPSGLYIDLGYPRCTSNYFNMWLHEGNIGRVGSLLMKDSLDGYPCGEICTSCVPNPEP